MNEEQIEALGLKPLQAEFAAIDAVKDMSAIPALVAHMNAIGAVAPYGLGINLDARNSTQYAVTLYQSGLGMPDRDYYLKDDAKLKDARARYQAHIEKMLSMAGDSKAAAGAAAILSLETSLAKIQWTRVEDRDPIKTYNKTAISELSALMPGYEWQTLRAQRRHRGQGRLGDHQPTELFHGPCQGDDGHTAAGVEGVLQVAGAVRFGPLSVEGVCRRALRLHRAAYCAVFRKISRAGSAALCCSTAASARRWASCMWRNIFRRKTRHACRRWCKICSKLTGGISIRWTG